MIVTREAHEVETQAGKLYVQILAAELTTTNRWSDEERDYVRTEEVKPRAWVATDPQFKGEVELGHLVIRGRKYTIDHQLRWSEGSWSNESTYGGPYWNEKGKQVDFRAKIWDTLYDLEREALAQFAEEHPDWATESLRQRLEWHRNHDLGEAKRLAKEAAEAETSAAKWQQRIDELTA
jgi:hypothetical protein